LHTADAVSLSPNASFIYVSGYGESALAVFRWDYLLHLPVDFKIIMLLGDPPDRPWINSPDESHPTNHWHIIHWFHLIFFSYLRLPAR
jgi:hypothetical protein